MIRRMLAEPPLGAARVLCSVIANTTQNNQSASQDRLIMPDGCPDLPIALCRACSGPTDRSPVSETFALSTVRHCDPLPNHALPDQDGAARRRWPRVSEGPCLGGAPPARPATPTGPAAQDASTRGPVRRVVVFLSVQLSSSRAPRERRSRGSSQATGYAEH